MFQPILFTPKVASWLGDPRYMSALSGSIAQTQLTFVRTARRGPLRIATSYCVLAMISVL